MQACLTRALRRMYNSSGPARRCCRRSPAGGPHGTCGSLPAAGDGASVGLGYGGIDDGVGGAELGGGQGRMMGWPRESGIDDQRIII